MVMIKINQFNEISQQKHNLQQFSRHRYDLPHDIFSKTTKHAHHQHLSYHHLANKTQTHILLFLLLFLLPLFCEYIHTWLRTRTQIEQQHCRTTIPDSRYCIFYLTITIIIINSPGRWKICLSSPSLSVCVHIIRAYEHILFVYHKPAAEPACLCAGTHKMDPFPSLYSCVSSSTPRRGWQESSYCLFCKQGGPIAERQLDKLLKTFKFDGFSGEKKFRKGVRIEVGRLFLAFHHLSLSINSN